jgi:hypothetical protein
MRGISIARCTLGCALILASARCGGAPDDLGAPEQVDSVESASTTGAVKIACGGPAESPFIADTDFSGGSTITRTNAIDVSAVYNPAPTAVYQSQRYGNFSYTLPGFTSGTWNRIRLHFADTHWTKAGQRVFNVTINGAPVLTKFDIIAMVGAGNKALVESFTMQASTSNNYVVQFTTVTDAATVSGIEVAPTTSSGTPTTAKGTAYATQCAQQLVPLPPPVGGSGDCASRLASHQSAIGCTAGAWTYSGQLSFDEVPAGQSFNGPSPVDIFYWESGGTTAPPGLCMMAAREGASTASDELDDSMDFIGVICQSAGGATCFWDTVHPNPFSWNMSAGTSTENGHFVIPSATVIASTTSNPPDFVGGTDLASNSTNHKYQTPCSDCHAGRNAFNNHPNTATDLNGRGLVKSATDWFPVAWPSPIVPKWDPGAGELGAPWPENPGPQAVVANSTCFGCHVETGPGRGFAMPSAATPGYCQTMIQSAVDRQNADCSTNPSDINCPTGAMPFSFGITAPTDTDPFPQKMLTDPAGSGLVTNPTAQCLTEFRTQFLPPPGGGTLKNGFQALSSTIGAASAITFGVSSTGSLVQYDPNAMKWVALNRSVAQVSLGSDVSAWTIQQSGTTSFVCASCVPQPTVVDGICPKFAWVCDSTGNADGYVQIAAGNGDVWAVDANRIALWEYASIFPGGYMPDSFFEAAEWPVNDRIGLITVGNDGDIWVLSQNANVSHLSGPQNDLTWVQVPSPSGVKVVSISAANAKDVWAASSSGLYRFVNGSWERHCLESGGCSASSFTTVAAGGDSTRWDADVWALDSAGNAYRIDRTLGSTTNSIVKVPGATLSQISVGSQGDVMGTSSNGTVYTFQ